MEYVPFEFCDSVVSLLSFEGYQKDKRFLSTAWQIPIDTQRDRINVEYRIGYQDGAWSYTIRRKTNDGLYEYERTTFEELQNLNRQNLRIRMVVVTSRTYDQQSSFEDIIKLVNFALPFVDMAELCVWHTMDIPQDDLLKILSLLRNSSVWQLFSRDHSEGIWAALSVHLKSESFQCVRIWDEEISAELESALKEYLLTSRFRYVFLRSPAFLDMDTFKNLFNKPQIEHRWELKCYSSMEMKDLRHFKKHLQTFSSKTAIKWKRQDGLVVQAEHNFSDCKLWIEFS